MKTFLPGRARIHKQQIAVSGVPFDAEQVRMPADQHVGRTVGQQGTRIGLVAPWPAADVRHANVDALAPKLKYLWKVPPQLGGINIAVYTPEWFLKGLELFNDAIATKIARVPDFIGGAQMGMELFIEKTVGIRKQKNVRHESSRSRDVV